MRTCPGCGQEIDVKWPDPPQDLEGWAEVAREADRAGDKSRRSWAESNYALLKVMDRA